jgi:hypothetical protein
MISLASFLTTVMKKVPALNPTRLVLGLVFGLELGIEVEVEVEVE